MPLASVAAASDSDDPLADAVPQDMLQSADATIKDKRDVNLQLLDVENWSFARLIRWKNFESQQTCWHTNGKVFAFVVSFSQERSTTSADQKKSGA